MTVELPSIVKGVELTANQMMNAYIMYVHTHKQLKDWSKWDKAGGNSDMANIYGNAINVGIGCSIVDRPLLSPTELIDRIENNGVTVA